MNNKKLETRFEVVLKLRPLKDEKLSDKDIATYTKRYLERATMLKSFEVREVAI